jgi:hypothetical protein
VLSKRSDEAQSLDQTIQMLEDDMRSMSGDSEEYATCLNRLERLYKLKEKHSKRGFNPDTLLIVGGNLLGIIIIVAYEHSHVIGSKAMSQVGKLR